MEEPEKDIFYRVMRYHPSAPEILFSAASYRGDAEEEKQTTRFLRKGVNVDKAGIGFFVSDSMEMAEHWVEQGEQDPFAYGIFRVLGTRKPNTEDWAGEVIDEMEILEEVKTYPPTRTHSSLALAGKSSLSGLQQVLAVPDAVKTQLIAKGIWKPFDEAEIQAAIDEGLATKEELEYLKQYNSYFS